MLALGNRIGETLMLHKKNMNCKLKLHSKGFY